jgi:PhzF family phenazine biosynthesis protein
MAHSKLHLKYSVLDVFTNYSWSKGNPLAIVHLTKETAAQITQEQKQLIAREFNFHETTFLHDCFEGDVGGQELRKRVDIFTKLIEVPFAGHPTIGTAAYCFNHVFPNMSEGGTLITKAGEISVRRDPDGLVGADIPCHNYRVHSKGSVAKQAIIQQHPELQCYSTTLPPNFPVISIAKGLL